MSTVCFTLCLVELAMGALLFGRWLRGRNVTFAQYWAASAVCLGLGLLGPAFCAQVGAGPWLAPLLVASHLLVVGCTVLLHHGTLQCWGLRASYARWYAALLASDALALTYFLVIDNDVAARMFITSLASLPALASAAYLFFARGNGGTARRLAWMIAALALGLASRGGVALFAGSITDYPHATSVYLLSILPVSVAVLIVALQFRLIGERSLAELAEQNDALLLRVATLDAALAERADALTQANSVLAALSVTDALTGIATRRRFDAVLASEWKRAARNRQPLALAMLDVDIFKNYNEHYGQQTGDECLRTLSGVMADNVRRASDLVARYGGEEFAFIAPATNETDALGIAENIRKAIVERQLPHISSSFGIVTASIGVAVMVPSDGTTMAMLLERADEALSQAKQRGRNRVVLADELLTDDILIG